MDIEWSGPGSPKPPASLRRAITSSLFACFFVGIAGYAVANYTTKQIVGTEEGALAVLVSSGIWLLSAFMAGFVAGYRAAGRGRLAGVLVGICTILGVFAAVQLLIYMGDSNWRSTASAELSTPRFRRRSRPRSSR
jgi:hypothetical protein